MLFGHSSQGDSQYVPYVIGMSREIGDNAATIFAAGFYKALAADRPIPEAHNYGCAELLLQGIQENLTPVLLTQDQYNRLEPINCDEEDDLRSLNSDVRVGLRFTNNTAGTVKAYWIDYDGKRQHYFDIRPNETVNQVTYVTHPWVITKADGEHTCIGVFLPNREDAVIIVD